mgnify:CR=1 FL=1
MKYLVGDQMEGFQIIRSSRIEEVNADAYLMEHSRSGARLLYWTVRMTIKCFISVSARRRIIPRAHPISWNIRHSADPVNFR